MTIHPTPDLKAKLDEIARRTGRDMNALAEEALQRYVDDEAWFLEKVDEGLAQIERGQLLEHDEVIARVEGRLRDHEPRP
jgi:predicted transcriptional regulator